MEWEADQRRVLDHDRGGLVVTGAPGSGKTTILRERFARLIEAGTDPERVVLFTLNRRAARQARDELMRRLARSLPDLPVFTVHGFAFRVLGQEFERLGYRGPPQVLSAPEQYAAVRQMLIDESPGQWPRFGEYLGTPAFVRQVADFVLRAQERLLPPDILAGLASGDLGEVVSFYGRYLDALAADDRVDFAGLLFQAGRVLEEDGAERRFDHVLVDDYQDATHAAEGIVASLAGRAASTVVAADPGGHVFSYRGGSLAPFRRLDGILGSPARVELGRSHRLGEDADALPRLDDPAADGAAPARLAAVELAHPGEEAEAVAHELLRRRVDEDVPWEAMAVILRRYGRYLTPIRHALARHGIPFVVVAESADIAAEPANRPVIELLRFVFREERRGELAETVLASPAVGLDPHQVRQLRREARRAGEELLPFVLEGELGGVAAEIREGALRLRDLVGEMPRVAAERGPDGLFHWLWTELPHFRDLVANGADRRDLDALAALGDVLSGFVERRPGSSVQDYLETLEAAEFGPDPWIPPEERRPRAVRVISAHRAQGLEFDVALIPGCLEGEFPSLAAPSPMVDLETLVEPRRPAERLRERLAEERALFRLAVSRARRATVLFASSSTGARQPRSPSRFAERLGVAWSAPLETAPPSVSLRSMEASLRRRLTDPAAPRPDRLAALAALPAVEARPETWWHHREWTDPGTPLQEGEFRTSYSRLAPLESCGLLYLGQTELGLDPDATHYMWLGSVIHDIIERVQKEELPPALDAILGALDETWEPEQFPNRAVERRRRLDAEDMLRRWFEHGRRDALESELQFAYEIGGARVRGRIDAVFPMEGGGLHVLDYKTGKNMPNQKDMEENLQLAVYYLGMRRDPEVAGLGEPRLLELAFLGKDHYKHGYGSRSFSVSKVEDYERRSEEKVAGLIRRIRDEDFTPQLCDECRFCALRTICPIQIEGGEVPV